MRFHYRGRWWKARWGRRNDDRRIWAVVPHEPEHVGEEEEEHATRHEADEGDEERRRRRSELGRPCTSEPTHLGMSHREDEEEHRDPS